MERLGELDKIVLDFDGVITSLDIDWRALRQKISGILGREINSILEALRRYYRQREYYVIHVIAEEAELDAVEHATINPEIAAIIRNAKEPVYSHHAIRICCMAVSKTHRICKIHSRCIR
jgi:hypothetical protein